MARINQKCKRIRDEPHLRCRMLSKVLNTTFKLGCISLYYWWHYLGLNESLSSSHILCPLQCNGRNRSPNILKCLNALKCLEVGGLALFLLWMSLVSVSISNSIDGKANEEWRWMEGPESILRMNKRKAAAVSYTIKYIYIAAEPFVRFATNDDAEAR